MPELSPIEACMQLSLFGGTFLRLADDGTPVSLDEERFRIGARSPWAAEVSGFNVHAGVTGRAGDREGLEKLCRYGARPPFSLERLSLLPDGRIAYRLRRPRRNGATLLVLEPIALMARLGALIAPPRYPLLRLSGVLAPPSSWRAAVVSRVPAASARRSSPKPPKRKPTKPGSGAAVPGRVDRDGAPLAPPIGGDCPGRAERSAHEPRHRRHQAGRCGHRLGKPAP